MKESEYWRTVFERLSLRYGQIWDYPITRLDILLEKEFYEYRKTYLVDEEIQNEHDKALIKVDNLQK